MGRQSIGYPFPADNLHGKQQVRDIHGSIPVDVPIGNPVRCRVIPIEQVVSIYTGVNGYLDDLSVSDIGRFEDEFLRYMHTEHQYVLDSIRDEKKISDETGEKLKSAAEKFANAFA